MEGSNNLIIRFPADPNSSSNMDVVTTPFPKFINYKYSSSSCGTRPPRTTRASPALEEAIQHELKYGRWKIDPNMDPKKIRRTILNRLSSRRSRRQKYQYINDKEKTVKELKECVSTLGPEVETHQEKNNRLLLENKSLQQRLELLTTESRLREMELKQKKCEIESLKEIKKAMEDAIHGSNSGPQQFQGLIYGPCNMQPYPSLSFYEFALRHLQNAGPSVTDSTALTTAASYQEFEHSNNMYQMNLAPSVTDSTALTTAASYQEFEHSNNMYQMNLAVEASAASERSNQEEVDIDQYLNFEALNDLPSSSSG